MLLLGSRGLFVTDKTRIAAAIAKENKAKKGSGKPAAGKKSKKGGTRTVNPHKDEEGDEDNLKFQMRQLTMFPVMKEMGTPHMTQNFCIHQAHLLVLLQFWLLELYLSRKIQFNYLLLLWDLTLSLQSLMIFQEFQ